MGGGAGGGDEKSIRGKKLYIGFHPRAKTKAWCSGKVDLVDTSEEDPTKISKKFQQVCQEEQNQINWGGGGLVQAGLEPENTFRTAG